jgi:protein tyrosine/serine phosphatase
MPTGHGKRPPAEEQIEEFLSVVESPENLPAFFHCNRARNRTYIVLGLYRIAHDGWGADQVIAEINYFGWKNIPDQVVSFLTHFANGGLAKIRSSTPSQSTV